MNPYDKMRDALMQVSLSCSACPRHNCKGCTRPFASFMPPVRKALSLPRRNCDVGTADEQMSRYCKFTDRYNPCSYKGYARCAEDCPIHIKLRQEGNGELQCQLEWAQMPYTP